MATQKDDQNWFSRPIINRLMQVNSIAECSKMSILQYFRPASSYHLSFRSLFGLFFSGCLRQVLLYNSTDVRSAVVEPWRVAGLRLNRDVSKTLQPLFSIYSTQEHWNFKWSQHYWKLVDWDVEQQHKQTKLVWNSQNACQNSKQRLILQIWVCPVCLGLFGRQLVCEILEHIL